MNSILQETKQEEKKCIALVKSYLQHSIIHGLIYLIKRHSTRLENFLWLLLVIISMCGCIYLGLEALERFHNMSTVVGIERDYYYRNTSLPSMTICPWERLNKEAFDNYCSTHNIPPEYQAEFYNFMHSLANASYFTFRNIHITDNTERLLDSLNIEPQSYMELIFNLTRDMTYKNGTTSHYDPTRVYATHDKYFIYTRQVLTENGLCYLTNTQLDHKYSSHYLIFGQFATYNYANLQFMQVVQHNYFDQETEYGFKGFGESPLTGFLHSNYETMEIEHYATIMTGLRFDTEVTMIEAEDYFEIDASVFQRKCRFQHETNLEHFPIYTKNLCLQECRLNLVYRLCGCIPHFYPNRIDNAKPVCHYSVFKSCLAENENLFIKLYDEQGDVKYDGQTFDCINSCFQNCLDMIVTTKDVQTLQNAQFLLGGSGAIISIDLAPTTLLKRQVIFSFTDFLVSIGGAAGLFLGFNVLGAVEFVYFFSLRFFWYYRGYHF